MAVQETQGKLSLELLKTSDLVAGFAVTPALDMAMGKGRKYSIENAVKSVVARSLSRNIMLNVGTDLVPTLGGILSVEDGVAGVLAAADSFLRKGSSVRNSLADGLKASVSSITSNVVLERLNVEDRVLM